MLSTCLVQKEPSMDLVQIASSLATKLEQPAQGSSLVEYVWGQREVAGLVLVMLDRDSRCKARGD